MKLALSRKFPFDVAPRLKAHFSETTVFDQVRTPTAEQMKKLCSQADVVMVSPAEALSAETIAGAANLKLVVTYSTGTDHIDLPSLAARKIPVVHTPDVVTDATADLAWALLMSCARRLKPALAFVEEGRWVGNDPNLFLGLDLGRSVIGIVGMGRIGKAVAQRALAFGMRVLYTNRGQQDLALPGRRAELMEVLQHSDIVCLTLPLNEKTRGLIGRRELGVMKPNGVLINVARGPIVDEKALLAHLRTHPEFYAGLDVFENEPEITAGLASLPNAFCVPHIGSATQHARKQMSDMCVDEVIRFLKGERLRFEYKAAAAPTGAPA